MPIVPNRFPRREPTNYRLAIIGEAPGPDEERAGEPFIGASGRFLKALLSRAQINSDQCFLGNISQHRPPNNEIYHFQWNGPEIQAGLSQLRLDLQVFKPNLCLLLGNSALKSAKAPDTVHALTAGRYPFSVKQWRGSLFQADSPSSPMFGVKCLGSYHPAACLRQYSWSPMLQFDIRRARRQAEFPELRLPVRLITVPANATEALALLDEATRSRKPHGIDIEGGIGSMSCISFAPSANYAFVIPFCYPDGGNYWPDEYEEAQIWQATARFMADGRVPKILQNSLYDRFVLHYSYQILVNGVVDDTMPKHWELYCELEKGLAVQASIYTEEPYYKFERKSNDFRTFLNYNGKDSAVTYEINDALTPALKPVAGSWNHYQFNMAMLHPLLYMELRGIRYDWPQAKRRRDLVLQELHVVQEQLDSISGHGLGTRTQSELDAYCDQLMSYKRAPGTPKKEYITTYPKAKSLIARLGSLTNIERAELSKLLELSLNVESPKQFQKYLYETLQCPIQTNDEDRPTADEGALLRLRRLLKPDSLGFQVVNRAIQLRRLDTHAGMLAIHPDQDGRIRCGYNIVGTETGRLTCYTSPTGSGYNLQTIPSEDRDLFVADDDYWMFQCDLAGADGWTVAAYLNLLGDDTMLVDLKSGIKPAKVLCLGLRGNTAVLNPAFDRAELKELCKKVKKEDWDYFACKIGQHGTCYLMGKILLSRKIFEESDGALYLPPSEAEDLQRLFMIRYRVKLWHDYRARALSRHPSITSASGHRRVFFGRPQEILGEALADEPQENTTYATNLAMQRLWNDPENRFPNDPTFLRIQPLHQVHDALLGQFKKTDTSWAVGQIKSYFDNPIFIANQQITIPFEGAYGPSWGELVNPI